jgi:hypothetical protein
MELQALPEGNAVRSGMGPLVLQDKAGAHALAAGGAWQSGHGAQPPTPPSTQEQGWLDELAGR